jgi:penicillin-binding protein 2
MVAVVNETGGTGTAAKPSGSVVVAGKTGTSQVRRAKDGEDGTSEVPWELRDHALFVAYYPAEAPRHVIAVVIEHGGGGGTAAAPYARNIIDILVSDDPAQRRSPRPASPGASKAAGSLAPSVAETTDRAG